jgi:hypothetical protein
MRTLLLDVVVGGGGAAFSKMMVVRPISGRFVVVRGWLTVAGRRCRQ